jgi:heme oxygenase
MFSQNLRASISVQHETIENTPLSHAIIQAKISVVEYGNLMRQMLEIHRSLEQQAKLAGLHEPLFAPSMVRTPTISADLTALGFHEDDLLVLPETRQAIDRMRLAAAENSMALLGVFYVVEGSRMGSLMIVKPLGLALNRELRPENGLDYHLAGARETPTRFRTWKSVLDEYVITRADQLAATAAAANFMNDLVDIYRAIPANPSVAIAQPAMHRFERAESPQVNSRAG